MVRKGRYVGLGIVVVVLVGAGVVVAEAFFAPERATQVDETDSLSSSARVLTTGTFSGAAGHRVSGTVSVVEADGEQYLRFENYSQTQGPDVFVYLTPAGDPTTGSEIEAGRKILVDGGAGGGESTKEGTFTQRLPDDVDPSKYGGVGIWCENFGVPFGSATLR